MRWAYGVTTVSSRLGTSLPCTLKSLAAGGFDCPHLFVDDYPNADAYRQWFNLHATARYPGLGAVGNWTLALWELYVLNPQAQLFAIFQDDVLCVKNLKAYLERSLDRGRRYWNLFTFWDNEKVIENKIGWVEAGLAGPLHPTNQSGLGALGLVFTLQGVVTLLSSPSFVQHSLACEPAMHKKCRRGQEKIDGAVVTAMNAAGWREMIHSPSLLQHQEGSSSMGNKTWPPAKTFPGEEFDPCS